MTPNYTTIQVTVLEAKNLSPMKKNGTSNVYVSISNSLNKQKFKTKTLKNTLRPQWIGKDGQIFSLFTSEPTGFIFFKVWNQESLTKSLFKGDSFMGELSLSLSELNGQNIDQWYKIQSEPRGKLTDGKEPGEIWIKIEFIGGEKFALSQAGVEKKKSIEDNYRIGKVLGTGAFSVVKEGTRKADGTKYAIKCINKSKMPKEELKLLIREIEIMKKLEHPNIIELVEVVDTVKTLYLVLEFAEEGELFDAILARGNFTEDDAVDIVKQILQGIEHIHSHGIAHRDLKPENLLLAKKKQNGKNFIKIADFGLSKETAEGKVLETACGTPDYVAPEVLQGEEYTDAVDIWSIGVITYVLLCGFPPFWGDTQRELFDRIMRADFDFPDPEWTEVSSEAKDFISKILIVDPKKRLSVGECLQHPWLQSLSKEMKKLPSFSVARFKEHNEKLKKEGLMSWNLEN